MSQPAARRFFTPKEVAAELAPAISEFTIIQRVRAQEIECSRGAKGVVLFTRDQIELLVQSMRQPAKPKPSPVVPAEQIVPGTPNVFGTTERSHKRSKRAS